MGSWLAIGVWRARWSVVAGVDARVNALSVNASPIRGAVVVAATSDDSATNIWISSVSASAATLSSVARGVTFGMSSARVIDQTGIDAVAIDASLSRIAFGVASAANCVTSDVGIAFIAFSAGANRPMVLHKAVGVVATVTRIAAHSIDAGLRGWTVRVCGAARRNWQHDCFAFSCRVWHPSLGTSAGHGP